MKLWCRATGLVAALALVVVLAGGDRPGALAATPSPCLAVNYPFPGRTTDVLVPVDVEVNADGTLLAWGQVRTGTVDLIDLPTRQTLAVLPGLHLARPTRPRAWIDYIGTSDASLAPTHDRVLTIHEWSGTERKHEGRLWQTAPLRVQRTIALDGRVGAWSPDGTRLAVGRGVYGSLFVLDAAKGVVLVERAGRHSPDEMGWSRDGDTVFFTNDGNLLYAWHLPTNAVVSLTLKVVRPFVHSHCARSQPATPL